MPERIGATVLSGSRNVFTVRPDGGDRNVRCGLKGKVLKGHDDFYNALVPGDRVRIGVDSGEAEYGLIVGFEERKNVFSRFNQKGGAVQLIAANIDLVVCVTSGASPPFRPRFIDRILLQADIAEIPALVVRNKIDLERKGDGDLLDADERLEDFRRIGYRVMPVSSTTGEGIPELGELLRGKRSVLTGQSGVGKSSLVNALEPGTAVRTGDINKKYDRGNHTTTLASVIELSEETWIIDTPGIRRFVPTGIGAADLILYMREFAPLAGKCTYGLSCSHRHEPGCKIMEAVHAGAIHEDRYESFIRIFDNLAGKSHVD